MTWKYFFRSNKGLTKDIKETLKGHRYYPSEDIFAMFDMLGPDDIRAVIVGQSPYPNPDACGIPFITSGNTNTMSLKNLANEVNKEYPHLVLPSNPNDMVRSWIDQGVFILNASLTVGAEGEDVVDHSVMWEEFIRETLKYIVSREKTIPVILMGSVAWALDDCVKVSIKVPHPVARGDTTFIGCDAFFKCNSILKEDPILWGGF